MMHVELGATSIDKQLEKFQINIQTFVLGVI